MKDVVLDEVKRELDLEEFIQKRVQENNNIFNIEEKSFIFNNKSLICKIYMLALLDSN